MYAIVKTGGKQYTVKAGDQFDVEKLPGEAGDKVELEVLFLNDGKQAISDPEALKETKVTAEIVEQHKGDKVIIFKFKKRKGYKRLRGHRQQLTRIAITDVAGDKAEVKKAAPKAEAKQETAPKASTEGADYDKMTVAELKDLAKEKGIKLASGVRKADIIETIQNA